jgi:hypothetical protein
MSSALCRSHGEEEADAGECGDGEVDEEEPVDDGGCDLPVPATLHAAPLCWLHRVQVNGLGPVVLKPLRIQEQRVAWKGNM